MPKLQDIDQFKASLKNLGREPEILAHWGETWHDMEAPPQGVPDDIASLLDSGDEEPVPGEALDGTPVDQDFTSFLDALPLGVDGPPEETPADGFELPGAFQEGSGEPSEDEFSVPDAFQEAGGEPAEDDFSFPDAHQETGGEPAEDEFSVPASLLEGDRKSVV